MPVQTRFLLSPSSGGLRGNHHGGCLRGIFEQRERLLHRRVSLPAVHGGLRELFGPNAVSRTLQLAFQVSTDDNQKPKATETKKD